MKQVKQCLILAAGNGSRLRSVSSGRPKPLVHFQGRPILEHVIGSVQKCGIDRFVIVVGYGSESIQSWYHDCHFDGISVTFVNNPDYHRPNGISALKSKDAIDGNFLLLMADHVFEVETARQLIQQPLGPGEVILAVDPRIDRVFDLEDATKVRRDGNFIVEIGKDLSNYDALDTGMFLCSLALLQRLEASIVDGNCSLSDGMRQLAREREFRAWQIGDTQWHDVDTPQALAHAERMFPAPCSYESSGRSLSYV